MSALLLLVTLFITPAVSTQDNAFAAWLNDASTIYLESGNPEASVVLNIPLELARDFSGELVILAAPEAQAYRVDTSYRAGRHHLQVRQKVLPKGRYLLLLHDFATHDLQTFTLVVK